MPRGFVGKIYTDMKKKYVQKVIPSVSTKEYRKLTPWDLRKKVLEDFDEYCRG